MSAVVPIHLRCGVWKVEIRDVEVWTRGAAEVLMIYSDVRMPEWLRPLLYCFCWSLYMYRLTDLVSAVSNSTQRSRRLPRTKLLL